MRHWSLGAALAYLALSAHVTTAQAPAREQSLADAIAKADVAAATRVLAAGGLDFTTMVTVGSETLPLTRAIVDVAAGAVFGLSAARGDGRVHEIARAAFAAGADPNFTWRQSASRSSSQTTYYLVERAVVTDDTAVLDILVAAGLDARSDGTGEALIAASDRGFARVVERLIAIGANVNHRQRHSGRTALSEAVHRRHLAVIAMLERAGAREWVAPPQ